MKNLVHNDLHVLIVEDNPIDQLAYKSSLKNANLPCRYTIVASVKEAKAVIASEKIKLAIIDYQLTDGVGFDLIPLLKDSLIVFVTGEGDLSLAVKAMKQGVYDFLVKDKKKEYLQILHQVIRNAINKIEFEQKLNEAESVVKRLSVALSSVDNNILLVNKKGTIEWCNDYFVQQSGYSRDELQSLNTKEISKLNVCGIDPLSNEFRRLINSKESVSYESENKRKNGENYFVLTTVSPILDENSGEIKEFAITEVDITKQKKHEEELLNAKLEAESSVRAKEQFLANMSHEIRTPMNAVLGMAQLMKETRLSNIQKKYLSVISESSNNLITIINDILDFSKINAGKIDIENTVFNLPQVLREVKTSFSLRKDNQNVRFIFNIDHKLPRLVQGDTTRIKQILNNLLSNSLKFTERGVVEASVKLKGSSTSKSWIEFEIKDSGIGISDEVLPHIFDKFTQANNSVTRKFGGTGLGLAIVKQLVELMGGIIKIESKLGSGTKATVVLPLGTPENLKLSKSATRKLPIFAQRENLKNINILLVEDNKMNQMLALQYLGKQGAKTTCVENGKSAYEAYLNQDYDIILMDLQMPVMGGIEATDLIRSSEKDKEVKIPILAMTAHALQGDKENCLSHGMDDYISKPIKLSELQHKILHLVSGGTSLQDKFSAIA